MPLTMLHNHLMDPIMEAAVEAVEEAILNALTAAETMQGRAGRTVHALPLDELVKLMAGYPYAGKAHQPGEED
jgi:D-aminopeptidase